MRFRTSRKPTPWLNRRDQWRMMRLVGMLTIVLIAINLAAKPETWRWMFPQEGAEQANATDRPSMKDIDFRVRTEDEQPLPVDVFRVQATETSENARAEATPAGSNCDVAIRDGLLRSIQDRTLGIPRSEAAAYYAVLAKAYELPPGCLQEEAEEVPFTVLMTHTEYYRGQVVRVRGTLRRLSEKIPAPKNDAGVEGFHEAWLTTPDSADRLYKVAIVDLPESLKPGEWTGRNDEEIRVEAAGYFFKSEGYATRGGEGLTTAPLLIAGTLERLPTPPPAIIEPRMPVIEYVVGIAAGLALLLGAVMWWYRRSDRKFEAQVLSRYKDVPQESLDALRDVPTTEPGDVFRRLTEEQREQSAT